MQDQALIATWLAERALKPVHVLAPLRGDKRRLLMLAVKNAEHSFNQVRTSSEDAHQLLSHLQRHLRLARLVREKLSRLHAPGSARLPEQLDLSHRPTIEARCRYGNGTAATAA